MTDRASVPGSRRIMGHDFRALLSRQGFADLIRWLGVLTPLAVVGGPSPADIICTVTASLFLLHAALARDAGWLKQGWVYASLALWAFLVVRSLLGEGGEKGVMHALAFIRFPVFAVALQTLVLTDETWHRRLALIGVAALGALALDAVYQYATGYDVLGHPALGFRLTGFYEHPWVGAMLSWLFLPVALSLVDQKRPRLAAFFGALCFAAILLSGDRMALLVALLALVMTALLFRRARRVFLIAVPLALLILGGFLAFNRTVYDRQVASTIDTIQGFGQSHYAIIWKSASDVWRDHPLFGTGRGGYRILCPDLKYGPLYPAGPGKLRCATHPHNLYLEWLVDAGLVGLGLFVLAMAAILRDFIRGFRQSPVMWAYCGLFVTLISRLWPLASWTSFHHAWSGVPFWLVVGWGLSYLPQASRTRP